MDGGGHVNVLDWYTDMPPVTRTYFTAAFVITAACALDVVSPVHLYFNVRQIAKGEVWRLLTNFCFFGNWGIDFLFHMYFLIRYCRALEEGSFRGKSADFMFCLLFGMVIMTAVAPFTHQMFLGSSLTFMLVYLWAKRNPGMQISLLGLIAFTAPYLPWVLLAFSLLLGHDVSGDALGIAVAHLYYFAMDVFPALATARGWRIRKILRTPYLLHVLFGTHRDREEDRFEVALEPLPAPRADPAPGGGAEQPRAEPRAAGVAENE